MQAIVFGTYVHVYSLIEHYCLFKTGPGLEDFDVQSWGCEGLGFKVLDRLPDFREACLMFDILSVVEWHSGLGG